MASGRFGALFEKAGPEAFLIWDNGTTTRYEMECGATDKIYEQDKESLPRRGSK